MRKTLSFVVIFSAGLLAGWFAQQALITDIHTATTSESELDKTESALEHAQKHLIPGYVCPMHPSVVSNEPGNCPICGMALEAKNLNTGGADGFGVAISPAMSNSLGIRIAHAELGRISEQVFASGHVESVTPATTTEIQTKIEGKVKEVFTNVGDWVAEGEFVMAIQSPHFTDVQDSYLAAIELKDYETMGEIRKKLAALDVRQAVIDGVDRANNSELTPEFIVEAPHSGILEWTAQEGTPLEIDQSIVRVATVNIARVRLRSYARATRAIVRGRRAQLDLPHMPGLFWPGRVVEINHDDAGFYSLIQADFEVPDNATEDGVFVGAYVNAGTNTDVLRIPASAVIRVEGESRVVRLRSDGKFEPVKVDTGFIGAEWAEIRSGLSEGDAVVERAQFLIDSEATLRAGFSRITE